MNKTAKIWLQVTKPENPSKLPPSAALDDSFRTVHHRFPREVLVAPFVVIKYAAGWALVAAFLITDKTVTWQHPQ